jgi:hypothetical protein
MKKYYCPLSLDKKCEFGGSKRFNYGFMNGTNFYCRKAKRMIDGMFGELKCPITALTATANGIKEGV